MANPLVDALNRDTEKRKSAQGKAEEADRALAEITLREFPRLVALLYWRVEKLLEGASGVRLSRQEHAETVEGVGKLPAPLLHVEYFDRKVTFQPFTAAPAPFRARIQLTTSRPKTPRVNVIMAEQRGEPGTWKLAFLERLRAPTRHKTTDLTDEHLSQILRTLLLE